MRRMLKRFPVEVQYYMVMNAFFSFGSALSGVFLSVFLWRLDKTFYLLAQYSLYTSISILLSFWICAWLSRKTSPMAVLRMGIGFFLFTYLMALIYNDQLANHIGLLGISMGLAIGLFSVGAHMAILDMTTNDKRDQFMSLQGVMTTAGGLTGPILAGFLIEQFDGMFGYYIVFTLTCLFMLFAILVSLKIEGHPIEQKNYLKEVLFDASREWKWMYSIMFTDGIVSGVYTTFIISMMIFHIAGGELKLGVFNMVAEGISIISLVLLARYSKKEHRVANYALGTVFLLAVSVFLTFEQSIIGLVIFALIKPVAFNLMNISMNTMIYAAIEKDPHYKKRRLDYIVVRELPLGLGRMLGVFLFLTLKNQLDLEQLLPVSFTVFPVIYILMVPILIFIHRQTTTDGGSEVVKTGG